MMRIFTFLIIGTILYSCSSGKKLVESKSEIIATEVTTNADTSSNYWLFDYINSLTENDYLIKLDSIKNQLSDDFFTLRMAYTKTTDFSPYDSDIHNLHKAIVNAVDSSNFQKALMWADSIFAYNYVDIKVHLYCGYIYKQMGDSSKSEFHYWCYDGLLNSIYHSGDGRAPKTAYIVITTKEEYALLNWFDLRSGSQSLNSSDGHSFDILQAIDQNTKDEYDIYFNIDIPIGALNNIFGGK